ncbi:hypothetical protein ACEQPO_27870 [Bacillus sp. SL00103]
MNDKIDNPKDNPMIMLKKLREKQQADVETVVRDEFHKELINKLQQTIHHLRHCKEAVNGKNKIHETSGS